ncbi:MAG: hypothetical protein L6W00_09200 [Lentisphaeria bacterium]|nr:MAG: hypothetical protein L6W00_09200 [Lentisphaeria bacterium]
MLRWSVHMMVRRSGFIAPSSSTALWVLPSKASAAIRRKSTPEARTRASAAHIASYQSPGSCSAQPGCSYQVRYSTELSPAR